MHVLRFDARGVHPCHGSLQGEYSRGAGGRIGEAGKREHSPDVLQVLLPQLRHLRRLRKIVFAVGHPQTALQQIGVRVRWIVEALCDPDSKQIPGLEVGAVQRVHVRAQLFADGARQRMTVRDGREGVQLRFERRDSFGFDGRFVHEGGVEIAHLAGIRPSRGAGFRRILDQG